jgi:hypothetical protein
MYYAPENLAPCKNHPSLTLPPCQDEINISVRKNQRQEPRKTKKKEAAKNKGNMRCGPTLPLWLSMRWFPVPEFCCELRWFLQKMPIN